jgi:hypothetical protein
MVLPVTAFALTVAVQQCYCIHGPCMRLPAELMTLLCPAAQPRAA